MIHLTSRAVYRLSTTTASSKEGQFLRHNRTLYLNHLLLSCHCHPAETGQPPCKFNINTTRDYCYTRVGRVMWSGESIRPAVATTRECCYSRVGRVMWSGESIWPGVRPHTRSLSSLCCCCSRRRGSAAASLFLAPLFLCTSFTLFL